MTTPFGANAPVLTFALRIAGLHPQLPAPAGLGTNAYEPNELSLCFTSPADVEAWREALHVPSDTVRFELRNSGIYIGFRHDVEGIQIDAFVLFDSPELTEAIAKAAALKDEVGV
ncbi:hypothetical protein [Streptomyces bauhiniae]|uniref:hypothetical protein n=1 Tax=Streptomyces bauhiniae TaxID=2340725 RepID=UPI0035D9920B